MFQEFHKKPLNLESLGFDSLQSFIDSISEYVHQRKVKDKILLYVKAEDNSPDLNTSLKLPFEDQYSSDICENDDPFSNSDKVNIVTIIFC